MKKTTRRPVKRAVNGSIRGAGRKAKESNEGQPETMNTAGDKPAVRVTCRGNSTISLDEISSLQGDLKSLSEENFEKLKRSILRYGISFPFFLWRDKDNVRILDGTQRDKVLKQMRADGYQIPPLPADWIDAENETEAKEKILIISSQYGQMTGDSLNAFLAGSTIDLPSIESVLALPELNIGNSSEERPQAESVWEQAIQLKPPREYVLIVCDEDDGAQFDMLKEMLDLGKVRRGGYKKGSAFDAVGTQRVVLASQLIEKFNANRN